MYPEELKYSKEHEWVRMNGNIAEVGVTVFAQESLGDVVFVDLPEEGSDVEQFAKFGEIESVKAVSDLFSPVGGKIVEVNSAATDAPEVVNEEPYGSGWLIKVELTDTAQLDELMDAATYQATLE
ncbi:glycine cleavage system protein GcvH [Candidatus Lucifugimonas marina]|jgi:glycine cleavage system H protein|uniref:Glycine cleavage system H protein n=1 Tax=Candidatus Lucifugimonas marina TaxID=3038979 RepID=A0AAJ5ZF29_9CHLR|nr:glycine cleavage system protein GcvH [SAR202 cluster bacterium JH702]MDG0869479.1 glycine cleavage system protein GcvH [SAR202 cluster bacterium JH639]WFG34216.1 glycine cleavage system protein GcvH [SAR202 cluster bacterium JH545]WFG38145.1 glycine cleavage system protein GcvH [SAR202 cluster bacterium JH1073]